MAEQIQRPTTLPPDFILTLHHVDHSQHVIRFIAFAVIYLTSAEIAVQLSRSIDQTVQWLLLIPFYLLAAASLHGISLFTHEAVHGTLCRNRLLNDLCGAICAFPVLQTCRAYRVLHLKHHSHLSDAGDPDHYENYTRWTWMVFIMHWLRLLNGYPVYITAIPILGFRQGNRRDRIWKNHRKLCDSVAALQRFGKNHQCDSAARLRRMTAVMGSPIVWRKSRCRPANAGTPHGRVRTDL